jgi:hypothetical protein
MAVLASRFAADKACEERTGSWAKALIDLSLLRSRGPEGRKVTTDGDRRNRTGKSDAGDPREGDGASEAVS